MLVVTVLSCLPLLWTTFKNASLDEYETMSTEWNTQKLIWMKNGIFAVYCTSCIVYLCACSLLLQQLAWGALMRCVHTQAAHNCGHSSLLSPGWFGSAGGEPRPLTPPRPTTTPGTDWWDEILPAKIKRSQCQNNSWYAYLPILMKLLISGLGG